ncbi:chemotaxis protein methyltransferase CheR [Candidatus Magnetomorum sp. HK-1]|nr:chemotaxis protein methyltransferase CheR [Candidatus Magnetomorum sp. HK-1]
MKISQNEFDLFRRLIQEKCGIYLDNSKAYLLENRFARLITETGCKNFGDLYFMIKNTSRSKKLVNKMIEAVTTKETLWFRDQYPYKALVDIIFPNYIKANQISNINIWSAGCSTGQEPYSIAITTHEFCKTMAEGLNFQKRISIIGTDISEGAIEHAQIGEYDDIAIHRGLSTTRLNKYLYKNGKKWQVNDAIKKMIHFEYLNLLELPPRFGPFDIVFIRNVMIYFSDELKRKILKNIASVLNKGGYLFLGTGETVQGYSNQFDYLKHAGGIFFQLK